MPKWVGKTPKYTLNVPFSGFYQTIFVNARICRLPFVKVRNEVWTCPLVCILAFPCDSFSVCASGYSASCKLQNAFCIFLLLKKQWYYAEKVFTFLYESANNKQESNFYLTSEKYNSLMNEVKEAKRVKWKKQYFLYGWKAMIFWT